MSNPSKPKLRMAPPASALASQQVSALEKLQRLQEWTEEPAGERQEPEFGRPPAQPLPMPEKAATAPIPAAPAPSRRPWESVPEDKLHPFTVHMSEKLFQKMAYCWRRTDKASAKQFLIEAVEAACDKALRDMGEAP